MHSHEHAFFCYRNFLSSFDGYVYARSYAMIIRLIATMFGFRHDFFATLDVMR